MAKKNPTPAQIAEIVTMFANGEYDREFAQAIIGKQVEIIQQTGSYRIHVSYEIPGKRKGSVAYRFDGRAWERHSSCAKIDETPGERDFRITEIPVEFLDKKIDAAVWDKLAAHFDREGYRFAIEIEAVELANAQPELQRKNWILALGSGTMYDGGNTFVMALGAGSRGRFLCGPWANNILRGSDRLLLVRKV